MKPLVFLGSARKDLGAFPKPARSEIGFALYGAQLGDTHPKAKPMKGLPLVEIVEDHDRSTYRAVYTVKFAGAIYVLHAFQKKSKSGIATPQADMDLIRKRLKVLQAAHRAGEAP